VQNLGNNQWFCLESMQANCSGSQYAREERRRCGILLSYKVHFIIDQHNQAVIVESSRTVGGIHGYGDNGGLSDASRDNRMSQGED